MDTQPPSNTAPEATGAADGAGTGAAVRETSLPPADDGVDDADTGSEQNSSASSSGSTSASTSSPSRDRRVSEPADSATSSNTPSTQGGRPGPDNTGFPKGTVLTVHRGDLTIRTPGTVIDGLDVHGFVFVEAKNVTIRNSRIRGGTTTSTKGLIHVPNADASVVVEDTELVPDNPSGYINGLHGSDITARRLNIHGVIDSAHLYGAGNVTIEDSWLHSNLHLRNDPAWNGGPSHDDSIQLMEGSNYRFRNNDISGATNAAFQFSQSRGKVSDVRIENNWIDGGACTINFSEKDRGAYTGIVITGNTFGRDTKHDNCAMIAPSSTTDRLTLQKNSFADGARAGVRSGS